MKTKVPTTKQTKIFAFIHRICFVVSGFFDNSGALCISLLNYKKTCFQTFYLTWFNFLFFSSIPVYFKWVSYLSWFRYGNEALMINQWENVEYIECPIQNSTCPKNGHVVLEIFSFSEVSSHFFSKCFALKIIRLMSSILAVPRMILGQAPRRLVGWWWRILTNKCTKITCQISAVWIPRWWW